MKLTLSFGHVARCLWVLKGFWQSPKIFKGVFYFSLFTFHFSLPDLHAQTLQVVTKVVEKNFSYKPSESLQIYAERSDIELSTWSKPEVRVVIELTAKHPERLTAERDLETMRYVAEKSGRSILMRNFIVLPPSRAKPQSNLKARYVLMVPVQCQVEIQNSFGKTLLRGLQNDTRLRTEFGSTEITDLKGRLTINTHFGELKVVDFDGNLNINAERTAIMIQAPKGECHVRTLYGSLDLQADKTQVKLNLDTQYTEIRNGTVAKKND
ncbi:MAG: hypothetical protein ACK4GN_00600 [Runella sp.]